MDESVEITGPDGGGTIVHNQTANPTALLRELTAYFRVQAYEFVYSTAMLSASVVVKMRLMS